MDKNPAYEHFFAAEIRMRYHGGQVHSVRRDFPEIPLIRHAQQGREAAVAEHPLQVQRELVGQILDYVKDLACWDYARLQAVLALRLGKDENPLFHHVAARHRLLDEARFMDAVERNLTAGRFLLLIAGDDIQVGARAIAEYLQENATLRFSLGLVEVRGCALPAAACSCSRASRAPRKTSQMQIVAQSGSKT